MGEVVVETVNRCREPPPYRTFSAYDPAFVTFISSAI
jgi:hypothetical protein